MPWFWEGELQGGGVLNDMMCHSVEEARFMLTAPKASRDSLTPLSVNAYASCLKWQRPEYAKILLENSNGKTDYLKRPAEDFARSFIEYKDENGERLVVETTTSWCFVGAGLRLSMELFGPEYSMFVNTLDSDLKLFFSRNVKGAEGEDLVEKQNAESGEMPVVSSETDTYGYTEENRHMVQSFLSGKRPEENFSDGVNVTELLMTAYMSAEKEKTIAFPLLGWMISSPLLQKVNGTQKMISVGSIRKIFTITLFIFLLGCGPEKKEWITLFDGQKVKGLRGYKMDDFPWKHWKIENGTLKTISHDKGVDIISIETFQDFELELEWKVQIGGNSGIFYFANEKGDFIWQSAPEMQVLDNMVHVDGKKTSTSAGALYDLISPSTEVVNPAGEFNKVKIIVKDNHVEHWLNGTKILEYKYQSEAFKALVSLKANSETCLFSQKQTRGQSVFRVTMVRSGIRI